MLKQLLSVVAMSAALTTMNSWAQSARVSFVESPTEGGLVTVDATSWPYTGIPPTTSGITAESATFVGFVHGWLGTGHFVYGLSEDASLTTPSDWVTVDWAQQQSDVFGSITRFEMHFQSDTELQPLPPPAGYPIGGILVENGSLQYFKLIGTQVEVGIQSDLESKTVPDAGATGTLLALGMAGLGMLRRFRD